MKGPLVDEEVSVADLLVREGWGERLPPPSRSRWRMVAVMLAVVVGCGAAAVLVGFGTTANDEASRITEMKVIEMPDRTDGAGGVSESNPPATIEGSGQGSTTADGDAETTEPADPKITSIIDPLNPRGSDAPTSSASEPGTSTTSDTSVTPTDTSQPGPGGGGSSNQPTPTTSSSHQPTPTKTPCVLGILCF
ncbi:hypothetical protein [Amycolatopsis sp. FDAARGOS 1241]|uniref:hypothetical protein n=1 Tax=Amycolatopsis sp. FDAARGOS 1241 TaxID=2778070 RepID=UPI00194F649D|nr:hypothetical protein [Amycolatopsis sp. FDAARGOS 1241]QRP45603.1 hypothetical protein I6J71_41915 [Amycolatopsis sp. FDAARGOS 1241]